MNKKIGILTGGGDCPGLNAVIRAVVKTAIGEYGYDVVGFKDGYRGLVLNKFVDLKLEDASNLLDKGGTILGTSNTDNPFNFRIEKDGEVFYKDMSDRVVENLAMHDIEALILIGGDGTMKSAYEFSKKGVNVVGVPKTIDNDLNGTELTFGFMTAVETATEAIDKLHSTAESHHRIMILEVMGRYAGWIALESGIAGGADIILIPEISYDINKVAKKILERKNQGKSFSIVVVAEGAKSQNGELTVRKLENASPDPIRLGGIGNKISAELEEITGIDCRVTVLGYLQRGGRPGAYDRILSTRYGVAAVNLVEQKNYGKMVSLSCGKISSVSLEEAISRLKVVDPDGEYVSLARDIGVCFGD